MDSNSQLVTHNASYSGGSQIFFSSFCFIQEHEMNTAVDNIEVQPETGDLWIGCHPVMYRILDLSHLFGFYLPSNVSTLSHFQITLL